MSVERRIIAAINGEVEGEARVVVGSVTESLGSTVRFLHSKFQFSFLYHKARIS